MLSSVRNASKSTLGTIILFGFLGIVVAAFALADLANFGNPNAAVQGATLAEVGDREITDTELQTALERQLGVVRQQNPEAQITDLESDFLPLLNLLIADEALAAFAERNGLRLSKALIDAEIARIPGVAGLDGNVSLENYQAFLANARFSDAEVRQLLGADLYRRLLVGPVGEQPRLPAGVARTYASMLLERRQGLLALIPTDQIAAAIEPTAEEVATFYQQNRARYAIPEQRILRYAAIPTSRFENIEPTTAEIDEVIAARGDEVGVREVRTISQVVVPTRQAADEIVARAENGTFAQAAEPAGFSAADISVGPQTRSEFVALAGEGVAGEVFTDDVAVGDIVGPVRSPFGFHVVKVDGIERAEGVNEAEARQEAREELRIAKQQGALQDLVADIEDARDEGLNFNEIAQRFSLEIVTTPPITAAGRARSQSDFRLPPGGQPIVQTGFEILPEDEPEFVELADQSGAAFVKTDEVIDPSIAPLAEIRDTVRENLIEDRASRQAQQIANRVLKAVREGTSMADALAAVEADTNLDLPAPEEQDMRRIDLARMGPQAPAPLQMLFRLAEGNAQVAGDPQNRGVFIVQLTETTRGDALNDPQLVKQTNESLNAPVAQEIQEQLVNAMQAEVGVSRNEAAIAAARRRILAAPDGAN